MLTIDEEIVNFSNLLAANLKDKKISVKADSVFLELDRTNNDKASFTSIGNAIAGKLYPEILLYKTKLIPSMNRIAAFMKESIENSKVLPESSKYSVQTATFSYLVTELIQSGYSLADGEIQVLTNKQALQLNLPETGLRSIFAFSNSKYNLYLAEILKNKTDADLEKIYSLYLSNIGSENKSIQDLLSLGIGNFGNLNNILLVLSAVDYYLNNRPAELENDGMYTGTLTSYQYNLVRVIKSFATLYENIKTAKRLILFKEGTKVYVDDTLLKEYQSQGGSTDALLGWLISNPTFAAANQTVFDILKNKDALEESWNKFVTVSKLNITDALIEKVYDLFLVSFNTLWLDYIPQELREDLDPVTMEEKYFQFIKGNKDLILKPAVLSRRLMGEVFFQHTNFKLFSETMVNYLVTHKDIKHEDAATYAILDMIIIYLTNQLVIE